MLGLIAIYFQALRGRDSPGPPRLPTIAAAASGQPGRRTVAPTSVGARPTAGRVHTEPAAQHLARTQAAAALTRDP